MTEQEARAVMKACGWSFLLRKRYHRYFVYAARMRRKMTGRQERYIGSLASLERLTEEELKHKLSCS